MRNLHATALPLCTSGPLHTPENQALSPKPDPYATPAQRAFDLFLVALTALFLLVIFLSSAKGRTPGNTGAATTDSARQSSSPNEGSHGRITLVQSHPDQ